MAIGRNEPCPCGSGRKYKQCCMAAVDALELERIRLRRVEAYAGEEIFEAAVRRYGDDLVDEAWEEFFLASDVPEDVDDHPYADTIFPIWMLADWIPNDNFGPPRPDWPAQPLILDYLERHPEALDAFQVEGLRAICDRPFSFYAVRGAAPGASIDLEDVMTGATHTVLEKQASGTVMSGGIVFGKVVTVGRASILVGAAPVLLPPGERTRLMTLRRRLAGRARHLSEQGVRDAAVELRTAFLMLAEQAFDPAVPELRNTDGDPLTFVTLHFDLVCTPREAFDGLKGLAVDATEEHLLHEARSDRRGQLRSVSFPWQALGNAVHKSWSNTTLGHISIDGARLEVEVNSEQRATRIREEIELRLGTRARFRRAVVQSPEKLLEKSASRRETAADRRAHAEQEEFQRRPEVQEALREMAEEHWKAWFDQPIPALDNRTPKQASRTAAGRERLAALLDVYALHDRERPAGDPFRADVPAIRRRLGL